MPRAGLSEERVVDEAEQLADEVGISRLTLAAVAERLGVRQPSLYKHIEGTAGLHRSLSIRAKQELAEILGRAAVGRSGDDAIWSMATAYRAWAVQHPGRYEAAQRAPVPGDVDDERASAAAVNVLADVLVGYELRGDDAIDAIRALRSALHGFVTLQASGGFGLPVDVDRSYQRMVAGLAAAFAAWSTLRTGG